MAATATVTTDVLNVRKGPGTEFAKIGELRRGDRVPVLQSVETWLKVGVKGAPGFVHKNFVFVPVVEVSEGFLRERADLQAASLTPKARDVVKLPARTTAEQRQAATTWNARGGLLSAVCETVDVQTSAAVAVMCVESGGQAFGLDGRMIIRFENHVFGRLLRKRGSPKAADFDKLFSLKTDEPWKAHEFRATPSGAWGKVHTSQAREWEVLTFARTWDEAAALSSISMGLAQVMGFNHASVGYQSVDEMFVRLNAPGTGERDQVLSLFDFVKGSGETSPMLSALRRRDYVAFAHRYNGPGQAVLYGERIEKFAAAFESL